MTTIEKISALESRQIVLSNIIASSDAHAVKCAKLGLDFGKTYPDDLKAYKQAIKEFNENEAELADLTIALEAEEAQNAHNREMPVEQEEVSDVE